MPENERQGESGTHYTDEEILLRLLGDDPQLTDVERRELAELASIPLPERRDMTDDEISEVMDISDLSDHDRQLAATFVKGLRSGRRRKAVGG